MVVVGGTDEAVVADIQQLPQILDGSDDLVHILLGLDAGVSGLVLDLLAVLVGAGQEHHIIPLHPLEAGQCVTGHGGVAVANVQLVAGVVDGGGDVELFLFRHDCILPFPLRPSARLQPGGKTCSIAKEEAKSSRPCKGPCPARTGAEYFRGTTLVRRSLAGRGLNAASRQSRAQPDAVTGAPGTDWGNPSPARLRDHVQRPDACPVSPPRALWKDHKALTLLFTADCIS